MDMPDIPPAGVYVNTDPLDNVDIDISKLDIDFNSDDDKN